jgi:hypothetical protein
MLSKSEIQAVAVHVSIGDLLGPLGYKKEEEVSPPVLQQVLAEKERCESMLAPQFMARFFPLGRSSEQSAVEISGASVDDEFLAEHLDSASIVAAAVCTLGPRVDEHIENCFAQSDYLAAMIADVVASRAAEELGEACSDFLCAQAAEEKLFALCRISPGYGEWDVSGQRAVFSLLDPAPIGVKLNEFCMMQPKKSVSFLIPFGDKEPLRKLRHSCQECNFKNCAYRRRS